MSEAANAETRRLDLRSIEAALLAKGQGAATGPQDWLVESQQAPARFFSAFSAWHDLQATVPLKSRAFGTYDAFHDLVLRHLARETPALAWDAPSAGAIGWRALGLRVSARAAGWRAGGVEPGVVVAIVRPAGPELLVSMLAAWKLGAVACPIPPEGRAFVAARLEAAAPAHVDSEPLYQSLLPAGVTPLAPGVEDATAELERSFTYASGAPAMLVFDPSSEVPLSPVAVPIDRVVLGALRDGALALGLRSGDQVAAPGAHPLEAWPSLACAVLASGATLVHWSEGELVRAPKRLGERPLRLLWVTPRVRELLARAVVDLSAVGSWGRDPVEAADLPLWQRFVEVCGLGKATALNVRWNAAGGAVAMSPRRPGAAHAEVIPAPGVPLDLADLASKEVPSYSGHGRLAFIPPGGTAESRVVTTTIFSPYGHVWLCAGSLAQGRHGRTYPGDEARELAERVPGVRACAPIIIPSGGRAEPVVVLIVFVKTDASEAAVVTAIGERLISELGEDARPERVECFALAPRKDDKGKLDLVWCRDMYVSGALARRARDPLFRALAALRERLGAEARA